MSLLRPFGMADPFESFPLDDWQWPRGELISIPQSQATLLTAHVTPSYSSSSDKNAAYMEVEMPGVPKESLTIDVKNDTLIIHGTRPRRGTTERREVQDGDVVGDGNTRVTKESEGEIDCCLNIEGDDSKPVVYEVKFRIDGGSDMNGIRADYHDGLLKICVPHRQNIAPRTISITA
jgi:HSP20 family molecular chaperone IbpA